MPQNSGELKSIKRIVHKVSKSKPRHHPTDSFSGRVRNSLEPKPIKSLDKYHNSELVRKQVGQPKQANTDREDDVVILGMDNVYKENGKSR